ncbi:MAG: exopolysaccharide biosynthesis protein exod [Micavibrio sp.]|nr:exopolysaccharide biosynthesis protein exod [Micavibrio sp.]
MNKKQQQQSAKLTAIVDAVEHGAHGSTKISVGQLMEAIESRGFGALLLLPALLTFLPTGGIPGVPGICAIMIILISGQMLMGQRHAYIPKKIKDLSIRRKKLETLLEKSRPTLKFLDHFVTQRFSFMFQPLTERIIAGVSILLAITFFPLAFIPFAVLPSAAAIVLMSLGLLSRDGLLVMIGLGMILVLFFMVPGLSL